MCTIPVHVSGIYMYKQFWNLKYDLITVNEFDSIQLQHTCCICSYLFLFRILLNVNQVCWFFVCTTHSRVIDLQILMVVLPTQLSKRFFNVSFPKPWNDEYQISWQYICSLHTYHMIKLKIGPEHMCSTHVTFYILDRHILSAGIRFSVFFTRVYKIFTITATKYDHPMHLWKDKMKCFYTLEVYFYLRLLPLFILFLRRMSLSPNFNDLIEFKFKIYFNGSDEKSYCKLANKLTL